jgi:hypothetical protein
MVIGRDQPIFPNRDATIAIGIDVAVRPARNPAADFEHLGLPPWIALGKLYLDFEFGDGAVGGRNDILLENQIRALD